MNEHLIALKLALDELGIPADGTLKSESMAHDVMYLAEAAGLHLGYHFGWYGGVPKRVVGEPDHPEPKPDGAERPPEGGSE